MQRCAVSAESRAKKCEWIFYFFWYAFPRPFLQPPAVFVSARVSLPVQFFRFVVISVALFPVCVFRLQVWLCEFCGYENSVSNGKRRMCVSHTSGLFSDELYLPTQSEDDYQNLEDTLVVFCVDISGSMSVTTEVEHRLSIFAQSSYFKCETGTPPPPIVFCSGGPCISRQGLD